MLAAIQKSDISLADWCSKAMQPLTPHASAASLTAAIKSDQILIDGPLQGECVVFTGAITIPRREAMERVLRAGGTVADNVTKETTLLVVGAQDPGRVGQDGRSGKQLKAEALILKGQEMTVLSERSFFAALQ